MGPQWKCCFCLCPCGSWCYCAIVVGWGGNPFLYWACGKPSQGSCICWVPDGCVGFLFPITVGWSKHTMPCVRLCCRCCFCWWCCGGCPNVGIGLYVWDFWRLWWLVYHWGPVVLSCPEREESHVASADLVVNCLLGSIELMCDRNCCVCSALWTKVCHPQTWAWSMGVWRGT